LAFQTKELRDIWWGKAREGHTFNSDVTSALKNAGWEVRENIELPELFNCQLDKNYGDVDVLAWRPDRNEVLIIECKDLSLARNYSEIAALLSEFQGKEINGEPDKLCKHLIRVSLVKQHLNELKSFINMDEVSIVSCLIFSGVVPMQYAKIDALSDTFVGLLKDIVNY
jgi:hypothetical protein